MTPSGTNNQFDEKHRLKVLRDAMHLELSRNFKQLAIPGHPKPYFISYLVRDAEKVNIWGRYGAISRNDHSRKRFCYADVRVDSYKYDQVTHGGLTDNDDGLESYEYRELPRDDDEDVIRFNLWRLTDSKYREAIEAYHQRKLHEVNYHDENKGTPAFQKADSDVKRKPIKPLEFDRGHWEALIRDVGESLKKYPFLKNSYLDFTAVAERKVFLSSEGVEREWQENRFSLSAHLWLLTNSGDMISDVVLNTPEISELPDAKEFEATLAKQIETMHSVIKGKKMVSYAGPVLLAPVPAGLLMHEVLGHRLEGSRLLSDDEGKTFSDKMGKQITHKDICVYDDPSLKTWKGDALLGHYPFDDEGSVPKKATLVKDGNLKEFLTTRAPIRKRGHINNGHARGETFERPVSRMGNLIIEGKGGKTWDELRQQLLEEIEAQNKPFGIILYSVEGGETGTEAYDFQAFLGEIKVAARIFPDGREEIVKGIDFVGTPMAALSNILAIGKDLEVDNAYCGAESGFVPVSTVSPALLLRNLELQAKDMSRLTQYQLPLPWYEEQIKRQKK